MKHFTKIEAAEVQLRSAIRLFFSEAHPIVVETLIGAASGVLRGLAKHSDIKSIFHESDLIKPKHRKEWIGLLHNFQNFFKHADNDSAVTINYEPRALHFLALEACILYKQLASDSYFKRSPMKEAFFFEVWFSAKYPNLLIDPVSFTTLMERFGLTEFNPDDFETIRMAIGIK